MLRLFVTTTLLIGLLPQHAAASPVGAALQKVVRANYTSLHRCYRKVLAMDRASGGTVYVEVALDSLGRVTKVETKRDELKAPSFARCLEQRVGRWSFTEAARAGAANASVVIPLTFRPDKQQFLVNSDDVPKTTTPLGHQQLALLHRKNVGLVGLALHLLRWGPKQGRRFAPSEAQLLFLLEGGLWTKAGSAARKPSLFKNGAGLYLPPKQRVRLTAGREGVAFLRLSWPGDRMGKRARRFAANRVLLTQSGHKVVIKTVRWKTPQHLSSKAERRLFYVLEGEGSIALPGIQPIRLHKGGAFYLKGGQAARIEVQSALRVVRIATIGL